MCMYMLTHSEWIMSSMSIGARPIRLQKDAGNPFCYILGQFETPRNLGRVRNIPPQSEAGFFLKPEMKRRNKKNQIDNFNTQGLWDILI